MSIISTSLTVRTQPWPRFHIEAWLPFWNREMDYLLEVCVDCLQRKLSQKAFGRKFKTVSLAINFRGTIVLTWRVTSMLVTACATKRLKK